MLVRLNFTSQLVPYSNTADKMAPCHAVLPLKTFEFQQLQLLQRNNDLSRNETGLRLIQLSMGGNATVRSHCSVLYSPTAFINSFICRIVFQSATVIRCLQINVLRYLDSTVLQSYSYLQPQFSSIHPQQEYSARTGSLNIGHFASSDENREAGFSRQPAINQWKHRTLANRYTIQY